MSLGNKHFYLLELISKNYSFPDIIKKTNFSERNIRYQINELNQELNESYEIRFNKSDILWNGTNKDFKELFINYDNLFYSYSSSERIDLLIFTCFFEKENLNINKLSTMLDVTKPTLRSDLKKLEEELKKFKIYLCQNKNLNYYFEYEEIDLYYFLASFIHKYQVLNLSNRVPKRKSYFYHLMFRKIESLFSSSYKEIEIVKKDFNINISDDSRNLFLGFLLALLKFSPNLKIKNNLNFYINTSEYRNFISKIETISSNNKIVLVDFLIGLSYTNNNSLLIYNNWINLEIEIYKAIKEFSKISNVELINDTTFINELLNHIKPMFYRIKKNIFLENSIHEEVSQLYKNIFLNVKLSMKNLEEKLEIIIPDEELGFITLMFQRALMRKKDSKFIENIVVVCNFGLSTSRYLVEKLKNLFSLKNVKSYSLSDFYKLSLSETDLIISTVDIDLLDSEIPIIKVTPFLSTEDLEKLNTFKFKTNTDKISFKHFYKVLQENDICIDENILKNIVFKNFSNNFIDMSDKTIFTSSLLERDLFIETEISSLSEVIQSICLKSIEKEYITSSYVESIISLNNPNLFIGNSTIFPHALSQNNVFTTNFNFVKLINPIEIQGKKCRFIIIFYTDLKIDYLDFIMKLTDFISLKENEDYLYTKNINDIYKILSNL